MRNTQAQAHALARGFRGEKRVKQARAHVGRNARPIVFDTADQIVAVVFVGSDCPLAKLYAPRLEELHQKYRDQGVQVLAVNSNSQDSIQKVGAYALRHKLSFPVLKDPDNAVADAFRAERTPHAFLLDAGCVVRYIGRIDDQYGLGATSGYAKTELGASYLADAIDDLLAGREVRVPETEPTG